MNNPQGNVFSRALRVLTNSVTSFYRYLTKWVRSHARMAVICAIILILIAAVAIVLVVSIKKESSKVKLSPIGLEYQQKLPELKKAVDDEPKNAEARKTYAVALYATADLDGAKDQYEEASKLNDKDAVTFNNLGNTYRDLQQTDKAISAYKKAIELNPKAINSYSNLGNVQLYSKNNSQDAIVTYNGGLKQLPDNIQLLQLLAVAYEQANNATLAKSTYQRIIDTQPENVAAKAALERLN
jgi:tetratricopeptide (TPR) repeat protein